MPVARLPDNWSGRTGYMNTYEANLKQIPDELKRLSRVVWQYEEREEDNPQKYPIGQTVPEWLQ